MRRLIFGLLALIAGFVFLDSARDASALDQAIKDRGVMVLSEPVEKYLTDRRRSRKSYSLPIVIKTPSGQLVKGLKDVSRSFVEDFKPGMQVKVLYLPEQPEKMLVVGEQDSHFLHYSGSVLMLLIGAGFLGSFFMRARASRG